MAPEPPAPAPAVDRLHFITVNYHCSDLITGLITATAGSGDVEHRFIVVNNSPADTTVLALAAREGVTLLQAERNLSFGSGCNLGLEYVWRQDPQALAWLINPDAQLLPGAIAEVRTCLRDDLTIAILGTRIQDLQGGLWFEQGRFDPWLGRLRHRGGTAAGRRRSRRAPFPATGSPAAAWCSTWRPSTTARASIPRCSSTTRMPRSACAIAAVACGSVSPGRCWSSIRCRRSPAGFRPRSTGMPRSASST